MYIMRNFKSLFDGVAGENEVYSKTVGDEKNHRIISIKCKNLLKHLVSGNKLRLKAWSN